MTKKQKSLLTRILIAAVLFIIGMIFPLEGVPQLILYLSVGISYGRQLQISCMGRFLMKTF